MGKGCVFHWFFGGCLMKNNTSSEWPYDSLSRWDWLIVVLENNTITDAQESLKGLQSQNGFETEIGISSSRSIAWCIFTNVNTNVAVEFWSW